MSGLNIRRSAPTRNFTILTNAIFADDRLGLEERGMLATLLSKPANWTVRAAQLQKQFGIGRDKFQKIMRGLRCAGYARLEQLREPVTGAFLGQGYLITDEPCNERMDDDVDAALGDKDDSPCGDRGGDDFAEYERGEPENPALGGEPENPALGGEPDFPTVGESGSRIQRNDYIQKPPLPPKSVLVETACGEKSGTEPPAATGGNSAGLARTGRVEAAPASGAAALGSRIDSRRVYPPGPPKILIPVAGLALPADLEALWRQFDAAWRWREGEARARVQRRFLRMSDEARRACLAGITPYRDWRSRHKLPPVSAEKFLRDCLWEADIGAGPKLLFVRMDHPGGAFDAWARHWRAERGFPQERPPGDTRSYWSPQKPPTAWHRGDDGINREGLWKPTLFPPGVGAAVDLAEAAGAGVGARDGPAAA